MKWATGVTDNAVALSVARGLPPAILQEQLVLHQKFQEAPPAPRKTREKLFVYPHLLKSRCQTVAAFEKWIAEHRPGWEPGTRVPRHCALQFVKSALVCPTRWEARSLARALVQWRRRGVMTQLTKKPKTARRGGDGHRPHKCPWLRQALFEWWTSIRHSIDWRQVKKGVEPTQAPKKLARFSASLVKMKATQLLTDYCTKSLEAGRKPSVPQLRSRWFREWRK